MRFGLLFLLVGSQLPAQLILNGPIPKTANPPVIFLNGYQDVCGGPFSDTFFTADKLLQAQGIVSLFFDNCSVPGKPSLETLGNALGQFIDALRYTDGTAVPQVDIIAHSMGGLIVRAYLAGMQNGPPATFKPPVTVPVRKMIFLATPHFGSTIASLAGGLGGIAANQQTVELAPGSQFLFDLNSWNQGTDDLRGVPAISVVGNGGTGIESTIPGFDDGVATLTSSSLGFYRPGFTRVLPYCHTVSSLLTTFFLCPSGTAALTQINTDPNNPVSRIIVSWLTGTDVWKTVGQAIESNTLAASLAGINLELRSADDQVRTIGSASILAQPRPINLTSMGLNTVAYSEAVPAGSATVQVSPDSGPPISAAVTLPGTTEAIAIVKPGPVILPKGIVPSARPTFPFDLAPGELVTVYGTALASSEKVQTPPYPTRVDDVQVLVNGAPVGILYAGAAQINIAFPTLPAGLAQLTVVTGAGKQTVNVRVASSVPAVFELGNSTAAAVNANTGAIVDSSAPLHAGDFVSIYLTGLGITELRGGLEYAQVTPTVTIGGQDCAVSYAGRAPTFVGLDQINCKVPAGVSGATVPVVVTAGGRVAPTVTLNIQ